MTDALTADLLPIQLTFLEELASKPDQISQILKDCKISGQRMAGWLADPIFRGAYMLRCAHYEEMRFPAFIAAIRCKAEGNGKDSAKFAVIYMDFIKERSEYLLKGASDNEAPLKELPESTDDNEAEEPEEESLPQTSIVDLLPG